MTALALQKERTALIDSLSQLIERCESVDFANILRSAILNIKSTDTVTRHSNRLSDEELEILLANEPLFDEAQYKEPTEAQWKMIASGNRGRLTKGLEKWL